ncbi:MAG: ECF transporter S component [Geodermatophilaceae bacterium]|nr:ECF transporter S component [Geodermatophilaceae bacterium]
MSLARTSTASAGQFIAGRDPRPVRIGAKSATALVVATVFGIGAFGWPLLVSRDSGIAHGLDAPLIFGAMLLLVVAVVLALLADGGMDAKAVAMLGVLAAIGAALRPLGAGTAGVEPLFFILILGGRAFGPGFGFVQGATTLFASALLTGGVGPWLPFQMLGAAWIGLGAGLLPAVRGRREVALLCAYAAMACLLYGFVMNLSFWPFGLGPTTSVSFVPGDAVVDNLTRFAAFSFSTSLGWDLGRAITVTILVALTAAPVLRALRRAGRKAAFDPVVTFEPNS